MSMKKFFLPLFLMMGASLFAQFLEGKKDLIMAVASVDYENCLLYNQKECNQCKQYCAYDAVSYELQPGLRNPIPVFDKEKCVGCAACKIVCPENVIHINPYHLSS